ncbi:GntR family transcriptional regulator [Chachezhania sediminis]|uniref:GntR family transcriptional regulator n=1 Tax=Chachezhania sediminis TaxID=2599291 RepID=UPI00131B93CB|nr:GntR family transcriptional regulator [Chachezhania sediminis]
MARASETLRRKLEGEINAGRLKPGDTIDEKSLAERFEVSRTPAREAIMQLAASGLVEMRPRHGAVVVGLNAEQAVAMMETLAILEAEAAALSAERMLPEEVEAMRALHIDSAPFAADLDSDGYIRLNHRFHAAIYAGARNAYLSEMLRQTRRRMAFYHTSSLYQKSRITRSLQEHGVVVEAISAGDPAAAREAMRDHILSGGRVYADLVAALQRSNEHRKES